MNQLSIDSLPTLPDLSTGAVTFPTLTREELAVLGDDPVLHDFSEEEAWAELTSDTRNAIHDCVLRGLVARELVEPSERGLLLDDRVQLLLGVRSNPAFLVVSGEVGADLHQPMRAYGIDLAQGRHEAVLLEFAADGLHRYLLARPKDAALRLATWILQPREGDDVIARTIEIFEPTGHTPERRRAVVLVASNGGRLAPLEETDKIGSSIAVDSDELADWLLDAWKIAPSQHTDAGSDGT